MENASKALYIAASVLVAVLILSLVILLFDSISETQNAREQVISESNLAALNAEYEAFKKRLMYGADVISCINKASSYNQEMMDKYSSDKKNPDLYINVLVHLENDVNETFSIWKVVNGKEKSIDTSDSDKANLNTELSNTLGTQKINSLFKTNSNVLSEYAEKKFSLLFLGGDPFESEKSQKALSKNNTDSSKVDYYYYLLNNGIYDDKNPTDLKRLVDTKQEYTYDFSTAKYKYRVKWSTAFDSFRKKAFTCDEIKYSENNGRITTIVFSERVKKK